MKHIRNPVPYFRRLGELIRMNAEAIRRHEPRADLQREMRMIRLQLMDWDNRQDRKLAA